MLAVKLVIIFCSIFAFTQGKIVIEDFKLYGNPEYIDSTFELIDAENDPFVNVDVHLKRDVAEAIANITIDIKIDGAYQTIYKKKYSSCNEEEKDDLIEYSHKIIEKFGDFTLSHCPVKMGHFKIRNMKMEDTEALNVFGYGHFKAFCGTNVLENGVSTHVMTYEIAFHQE